MSRRAATKAAAAAAALEAFLRRRPAVPVAQPGPQADAAPDTAPAASSLAAPDGRLAAVAAENPETGADRAGAGAYGPPPPAVVPARPGGGDPAPDAGVAVRAAAPGDRGGPGRDVPLHLAHPDWLYHRLTVTGSPPALAAFQAAAAGAGIIPWQLDPGRIAEDVFLRLAAPPAPQQRSLSLAGARILADLLRDAVVRRHDLALARVGHSRACPFDLHALVPVPGKILRRGPDDPAALAWLWGHWGTTDALRHVTAERTAGPARRDQPAACAGAMTITFWSADWSPWRVLAQIAARWPALRFDLRPSYDEAR